MSGRHCKTCRLLGEKSADGHRLFFCGWTPSPVAWAYRAATPWTSISPRHVVPGDHYEPDAHGSTQDWTEKMDCPVWEVRP